MKRFDKYDLLLETLGFPCSIMEFTENDFISYQDEVDDLAKELGIDDTGNKYVLILFDDDIHDMDDVVYHLHWNLGFPLEESERMMYEAHFKGKCNLRTSSYKNLYKMQEKLKSENYRTIIRKVEK